jgi:hypothetical protein
MLVIGACIIATVKLARDEGISKLSPRVLSVVADALGLSTLSGTQI